MLHVLANPEATPPHTGFGYSIDVGSDLDGDGFPELVVGAPQSKAGGTLGGLPSGATFVYSFVPGLADYGTGTAGCAGAQFMNASDVPFLGNAAFALRCTKAPLMGVGLAMVGDVKDAAGSDPFGLGILLHVDLLAAGEIYTFDLTSDAAGVGTAAAPIPVSPLLVGNTYYAQELWRWDPGIYTLGPFGLSTSNGLTIVLQP